MLSFDDSATASRNGLKAVFLGCALHYKQELASTKILSETRDLSFECVADASMGQKLEYLVPHGFVPYSHP